MSAFRRSYSSMPPTPKVVIAPLLQPDALQVIPADRRALQRRRLLGHIRLGDDPALKAGRPQAVEDRRKVDEAFAKLGEDAVLLEGAVIPTLRTTLLEYRGVDVFDVHRLDAAGIVATKCCGVHPCPCQVNRVPYQKDQVRVAPSTQHLDLV